MPMASRWSQKENEVQRRGLKAAFLSESNILYSPSVRLLSLHQMTRSITSPHWGHDSIHQSRSSQISLQHKLVKYYEHDLKTIKRHKNSGITNRSNIILGQWKSKLRLMNLIICTNEQVLEIIPLFIVKLYTALLHWFLILREETWDHLHCVTF